MDPKIFLKKGTPPAVWLLSLILVLSAGLQAALKVRVIAENANIKATPEIGSQILLANVPANTILETELKQGQFYKVTAMKEGLQISGYIHELQVQEVSDEEAKQTLAALSLAKSQDQVVVELGLKLEESRNLIRLERDLPTAVTGLRPLLAKAFAVEDRLRQRQLACEIFYWLGLAFAKQQDHYGALMEFRNMFEVDAAYALEITRNLSDPFISRFIDLADKQHRGMIVDYSLEIVTEPKEAMIKIDGKEIGRSPTVYRSAIPKFTLEIEREGYRTHREDVFLFKPGETRNVRLESIGRTIALQSQPAGATVFLDGQDTGKLTDCQLPFVPYGARKVRLEKKNYADWEETVQVLKGEGPLSIEGVLPAKEYISFRKWGGLESKSYKLPRAIVFDREGSYYLLDESKAKARKFDAEGRNIAGWGEGGNEFKDLKEPTGIAIDGQGNVYITSGKGFCVLKFSKDGKFLAKWGKQGLKPGEFGRPAGIAVGFDNTIYVADAQNNCIAAYSSQGALIKTWGKPGVGEGEFSSPTALAVNQKNEVIVVDRFRVQSFSADGRLISAWGKPGSGDGELRSPMGVCVDAQNCIYVADTGNHGIQKFGGNGRFICRWGGLGSADGRMSSPVSVAVRGNGSVIVVERDNNRLQEFRIPSE